MKNKNFELIRLEDLEEIENCEGFYQKNNPNEKIYSSEQFKNNFSKFDKIIPMTIKRNSNLLEYFLFIPMKNISFKNNELNRFLKILLNDLPKKMNKIKIITNNIICDKEKIEKLKFFIKYSGYLLYPNKLIISIEFDKDNISIRDLELLSKLKIMEKHIFRHKF